MRPIQVKQLDYDLTPTAGLTLVGHHLKALAPDLVKLDAALRVRNGVASSDILRSYLPPSSPTLRQRMDANATALSDRILPMIECCGGPGG